MDIAALTADIRGWAEELGFQQLGITDVDVSRYAPHLAAWLEKGFHGEMGYMARNVEARLAPGTLVPGTIRIISARMDYQPPDTRPLEVLRDASRAYVSRYALGRDYHKVLRPRLASLARRIDAAVPGSRYRAFTDSAPVLEKPVAEKAGLGWIGKHSVLINADAGSYFFLGEIYTNLPLPADDHEPRSRCGKCRACLNVCPTGAIVDDKVVDARRCISYLTIEHKGAIPEALRERLGNRVFGCDDCQLVCPWNRFAKPSREDDFKPRHALDDRSLLSLFDLDEDEFLALTEGSAIRRVSYAQWQRNLAVALGNAGYDPAILTTLRRRREGAAPMVREHIDWAISRQRRGGTRCCDRT